MSWKCPFDRLLEDRSGAVLLYVTVLMSLFIGVAAFAVDFSLAYWTNNRLQIAADASALAGASQLPNDDDVISEAMALAVANMEDDEVDGNILVESDVEIGCWDGAQFDLMPCAPAKNAVRVTTRRSTDNDNPMGTIFGSIFGTESFNLVRRAVAEANVEECLIEGLVAAGKVEMGSTNTLGGVCMHGQEGLKMGSDNDFTDAALSIGPGGDVEAGGNNSGLDDPMTERDLPPSDALRIDEILADIALGNGPWPDYLVEGQISIRSSLPSTRVAGTLYIVDNDVNLSGNLNNFGVYSKKKITISSDAKLRGIFLASKENVESGSHIEFGNPDYCSDGTGSVFMAAMDQVKLGSNNDFTGVQIIAGNYVDMGSNLEDVAGLAVQSGGDIKMGSAEVSECERTTSALLGGGTKILRLVQ